jgi:hypothetical protein
VELAERTATEVQIPQLQRGGFLGSHAGVIQGAEQRRL